MPLLDLTVECPVHNSFGVQKVADMFGLPVEDRAREAFSFELPDEDEHWSIGLVVGPSGSGKSTLARAAFGDRLHGPAEWPEGRAVVDCFGDLPVLKVVELLTAVGLGSAPSWVKPYAVLSNGERFRCDLARALATSFEQQAGDQDPIIAYDEFTSVVDRHVGTTCAAAIAKSIRGGAIPARFVAVTCHKDVADWLEPEWVLDTGTGRLTRRRLRRPRIELRVHRTGVDAWPLFARHHYLSGSLAPQAKCYLATWRGEPVAFSALLPVIAQRGRRRFTRIVTLPDYQGVGIGSRFMEAVADLQLEEGLRVNLTSSHPALVGHCRRSPRWKATALKKAGRAAHRCGDAFTGYRNAAGRAVVSFEYLGRGPEGGVNVV